MQTPVIDPNISIVRARFGEPQSGAANTLVLPQLAARRITDRNMCDQQLACGKGTWIVLLLRRAGSEKGHLESSGAPRVVFSQP